MIKPILEQKKKFTQENIASGSYTSCFTSGMDSDQIASVLHNIQPRTDTDYACFDSKMLRLLHNIQADRIRHCYKSVKWEKFCDSLGMLNYNIKMGVRTELEKLVPSSIARAILYNSTASGGPTTTLFNSEENELIYRSAAFLVDLYECLNLCVAVLGDDGASDCSQRVRIYIRMLTQFLGMDAKINECSYLPEYNSQYLVYDTNNKPMLVPKAVRSLKRIYVEPRKVRSEYYGEMTLEDLFILQCINYSEGPVLKRVPFVRRIIDRSIALFGSVKLDHEDFGRLVKNKFRINLSNREERTMCPDYFDRYSMIEYELSGDSLIRLEDAYERGIITDCAELILNYRNPTKSVNSQPVLGIYESQVHRFRYVREDLAQLFEVVT
jgi:hypothetical protein